MAQFLARVLALDFDSVLLVVCLCAIGFVIMKEMINIPGLAFASFPLLVASSLSAQILLADLGVQLYFNRAGFLAFATGVGMTAALVVVVLAVRIAMLMTDKVARQPEMRPGEARQE